MKSKEFCLRIAALFGVSNIEQLKEKVKLSPTDGDMRYSRDVFNAAPNIQNSIRIEEIGSLN